MTHHGRTCAFEGRTLHGSTLGEPLQPCDPAVLCSVGWKRQGEKGRSYSLHEETIDNVERHDAG